MTGVGSAGRVRVSTCLAACEWSNVVVVGPDPAERRAGARPIWLADVHTDDIVAGVVEWVRRGGPGIEDPPPNLERSMFSPSRRGD